MSDQRDLAILGMQKRERELQTRITALEEELDKLRVAWSERGLRAALAEARAANLESAIRGALFLSATGEIVQAAEVLESVLQDADDLSDVERAAARALAEIRKLPREKQSAAFILACKLVIEGGAIDLSI